MLRHLLSGALVLAILATALIAHAQTTAQERTRAVILERMRNLGIVPGSTITIDGARFEILSIAIAFDSNSTPQIVVQFRRQ